jgi:hypothetical protein
MNFRLDRAAYAELTFEEADKAINDYAKNTWEERLLIAKHLTAIAYNYPVNKPPRMDKTLFEIIHYHG